jgi:Family of unknown function (DUF6941)
MAQLLLPRVQAMMLCDELVESDFETNVYNLTGVRSVIESPFPAVVGRLCVFAHMSGHEGEALIHVEIDHVESANVIFQTESKRVNFLDPTLVVPVAFILIDCVFPSPGVYYVQVIHEQKIIGERPLVLNVEG